MRKICFILDSLTQGGSERQMIYTCEALARAGLISKVLVYGSGSFYEDEAAKVGIDVEKNFHKGRVARLKWLHSTIKREKPAVVVSLVKEPSIYAMIAMIGIKNCKLVLSWRYYNNAIFTKFYEKLVDANEKKIKAVVCNSIAGKELWNTLRPQDSKKTYAIYNIIKDQYIQENSTDSVSERITILVMARVQAVKNTDKVISAIEILPVDVREKIHILWYGDASGNQSYREKIIEKVRTANISDVISIKDAVKDVNGMISNADIVALFSESEGFPNAICEGMMCQKAIIMTKVSDYDKLVDAGNGFLVKETSIKGIEEALVWASQQTREQLIAMGKESRNKACRLFDNDETARKWIEIVND